MTQLTQALEGKITQEMKAIANQEQIELQRLGELIAKGRVVIPYNRLHKNVRPVGIGQGLKTKINTNIGTSPDRCNLNEELEKLRVAVESGTDTVMDLSTGGNIDLIRKKIIENCPVPLGTVPIYQAVVELLVEGKNIEELTEQKLLDTIEKHGQDGVDFITIHCGVTLRAVKKMDSQKRLMDVVSRGGSFLVRWMQAHEKENPLYVAYDKILEIAKEYDITLSLGDGLRPGCLHDATDNLQIDELLVVSELRDRAVEAGVQVMIEGPGHIPIGEIMTNVQIEKKVCKGAPFYVLGPVVTDVAPGYDHIVGAIGGALAASYGVDFLCYLTPSEHLRLPTVEDVREGVVVTKIAAHIGDIEKGVPGAKAWDDKMSQARKKRDWEEMFSLALDPKKPKKYREESQPQSPDVCTMCGEFCSIKTVNKKLKKTDLL